MTRDPSDHLAFGRGVHRCVGMDLATLEVHTPFTALAERIEGPALVAEPEWATNSTLHGPRSATPPCRSRRSAAPARGG